MSGPWQYGDPTPLATSAAVVALWEAWGDPRAVLNTLTAVRTWAELVALAPADRVRLVGPVLASTDLPVVCPPLPDLAGGGRPVTPYDSSYPRGVPAARWPVLYCSSPLPTTPGVLVAGAETPSPQAVEIARSAALAAAAERIPVIATTYGVGLVALRTVADAAGVGVAVLPCGLDRASTHQGLLDELARYGGAAVTAVRDGVGSTPAHVSDTAHLAAFLAGAVVIAEVGAPPSLAATFTRAAVSTERVLIAPPPAPGHTPASAVGLGVLTHPRMFTPEWYGTSPRIAGRVRAGLPAADYVVTSQAQIGAAIRAACLPAPTDPSA